MAPDSPACFKCGEPVDYFRAAKWEKHQDRHVRKPDWIKLSLGFFEDDVVHSLPDSQRLAFIAVLVLCGKRGNRVKFDANYIKEQCNLRATPALSLFMAQGLIEHVCCKPEAGVLLEERRGEETRGDERREEPAAPAFSERAIAPSKPRGQHGTEAQRAAVDRCSVALGVSLSYSKANIDAVTRAEKHYSGEEVVRVLTAIRDGATPSAKWCLDRLHDGLALEYILRPGSKGAADKILEQLQRGDTPTQALSAKAQAHQDVANALIFGGLRGDLGQGVGGGDGGPRGLLLERGVEHGHGAAARPGVPSGPQPPHGRGVDVRGEDREAASVVPVRGGTA